jgi:ADP-ribose pyrophosphatase YjhB (NUDIX family)
MNRITRYGAYGVLLDDSKILLTRKKSGPYKGLWGLPGGGIEFGETPESTLKRELLEETGLQAGQLELLMIATSNGEYDNDHERYQFHHIGIIYRVLSSAIVPNLLAEEEWRWVLLGRIKLEELTPFAMQVLKSDQI